MSEIISDILDTLGLTCSAYFGATFTNACVQNSWSTKIAMFSCFMGGSVIWYSYQGFITSTLAARSIKLPFTNLEEFDKTDYRYL
jgi:hypothetical protein